MVTNMGETASGRGLGERTLCACHVWCKVMAIRGILCHGAHRVGETGPRLAVTNSYVNMERDARFVCSTGATVMTTSRDPAVSVGYAGVRTLISVCVPSGDAEMLFTLALKMQETRGQGDIFLMFRALVSAFGVWISLLVGEFDECLGDFHLMVSDPRVTTTSDGSDKLAGKRVRVM